VSAPRWHLAPNIPKRLELVSGSRAASRAEQHLGTLLDTAVGEFCTDARDASLAAALRWIDALARIAERATRDAAARLRRMVVSPVSDEDLAVLADLEGRLAEYGRAIAELPIRQREPPNPLLAMAPPPPVHVAESGCALCERLERVLFDHLASAQYRLASRERSQIALSDVGGYCPLHTWNLAFVASDLGIAAAYARFAEDAGRALQDAAESTMTSSLSSKADLQRCVAQFVQTPVGCPACQAIAAVEHEAILELLHEAADDGEPPPLCLLHLASMLRAESDDARARQLVSEAGVRLHLAAQHMRSYALKRESRMRHLVTADEKAAQRVTLALLVGRRSLAYPWFGDELAF
jgi:hypothetical protein